MTTSAENPRAYNQPLRLWGLLACHLVVMLLFAFYRPVFASEGGFATGIAVSFAQAGLLAILAALTSSSSLRVAAILGGLFVGMLVIYPIMHILCALVHARDYTLCRFQSDDLPPAAPLRFSLRDLFLLTAVVGLLVSAAIWIHEQHSHTSWIVLAAIWMFGMPRIAMGAVLGQSGARERSAVVLAAALGMGLITHVCTGNGSLDFLFFPYLLTMNAAILVLSLLVVRSCGYRLVKQPQPASNYESSASVPVAASSPAEPHDHAR